MKTPIYPEVDHVMVEVPEGIKTDFKTHLRREYEGVMYIQEVYRTYVINNNFNYPVTMIDVCNRFHAEVYQIQMLEDVKDSFKYVDVYGVEKCLHEKDIDQQTERDRLVNLMTR